MTKTCAAMRRDLEAFIDGELRGAAVLRVNRHVRTCASCAAHADETRRLGDLLRTSAATGDSTSTALAGLASTVISRTRAEDAESWLGVMRRACEDWHWMAVGASAVAATLILTATTSALLAFGPKPQGDDSLASIVAELVTPTPSGYLFADVAQAGSRSEPVVMQVDNGSPRASAEDLSLVSSAPTQQEMVHELFDLIHRRGALYQEGVDPIIYRGAVMGLSTGITSGMLSRGVPGPGAVEVRQIRLLASVKVVAQAGSGS